MAGSARTVPLDSMKILALNTSMLENAQQASQRQFAGSSHQDFGGTRVWSVAHLVACGIQPICVVHMTPVKGVTSHECQQRDHNSYDAAHDVARCVSTEKS